MGIGSISLVAPDAEERLLASSLGSTAAFMGVVGSGLRPEDFGSPGHELIYRTMRSMMDRGQGVDSTTLTSELEASGKLDLIGGRGVIDRLVSLDGGAHVAHDYAGIVKDRSIRRRLFDATEQIVNEIHSQSDVRDLISISENLLYRVADSISGGSKDGLSASDLVELYRNRQDQVERIVYPFQELNNRVRGRERGSLTIWGGYTSDGKSIIGLQSALAAAQAGYKVGYFSLEMTEEELLYRLLSMCSGVEMDKIQTGELTLEEDGKVNRAVHTIAQLPIKTYHDPELTPTEIRTIQKRDPKDLIVVDYLQRFDYGTDFNEIPRIAKQFKNIALQTKCAVDLMSQLTPSQIGPGQSPFPIPHSTSLYGGKATSNEANNIMFIWAVREKNPDTKAWERTGMGKIISAKQRGGKGEFTFDVSFDPSRVMWRETKDENVFYLPQTNK